MFLGYEFSVNAAAFATAKDIGEQVERYRVFVIQSDGSVYEADARDGCALFCDLYEAWSLGLGFFDCDFFGVGVSRYPAEIFFSGFCCLFVDDSADDDEGGIVGDIILFPSNG